MKCTLINKYGFFLVWTLMKAFEKTKYTTSPNIKQRSGYFSNISVSENSLSRLLLSLWGKFGHEIKWVLMEIAPSSGHL